MNSIIGYVRQYLQKANWKVHGLTVLMLCPLVFANYYFNINHWLYSLPMPAQFIGWYLLLLGSFLLPYLLCRWLQPESFLWTPKFWLVLLAAPLLFAWKMTAQVHFFTGFSKAGFWNQVLYFPLKVLGICSGLYLLRLVAGKDERMMGLRAPISSMRPYWIMLALMVPLVLLAGTQPDFLAVYPKVAHVIAKDAAPTWYEVLLFELAYGSDFITIELFFRGFLVIYFARWAGRYAILPMAVFYCVIHFGKPLGECISSFFGGMLLGIVSYRTQSIWGGLVVHLGIAWLMELVAYPLQTPLSP